MKRILITALLYVYAISASGQVNDLVATDGILNELHQGNIGKIVFTNGNIPLETLQSGTKFNDKHW